MASLNETRQTGAVPRARALAPILAELAGMSACAMAAEFNARRWVVPEGWEACEAAVDLGGNPEPSVESLTP
jgi:hypothetical protein